MKGLPTNLQEKYPDIPWNEIAGARDVLSHEYFRVDSELTWEMVREDLPRLAGEIEEIIRNEGVHNNGSS